MGYRLWAKVVQESIHCSQSMLPCHLCEKLEVVVFHVKT